MISFGSLCKTCIDWYIRDKYGHIDEEDMEYLSDLNRQLKNIMLAKAKTISEKNEGYEISEKYPGYLKYTIDNYPIYIPWFILDDFPRQEIITFLVRSAIKIKACKSSAICISGSTLYFNSLQSISDIDYLEYQNNQEDDPPIINSYNDFEIIFHDKESYVEYIVETPFYGIAAVSNKIVQVDNRANDSRAAPESHPAQEVPITTTPRVLHDPVSLGRYLFFLVEKTFDFAQNLPCKAAKRLLPLSRIIEDNKIAEFLIECFSSRDVLDMFYVKQKVALIKKLNRYNHPNVAKYKKIAISEIKEHRNPPAGEIKLTEEEKQSLNEIYGAIRLIIKKNRSKLRGLDISSMKNAKN
jgi:hypothetical protein